MATQRAKKKKARRDEQLLAAHLGESTPIRAVRVREVCVPCPACAHPLMERRYLPMFGGASGSARCPSCTVEMPYARVLAAAMGEALPEEPVALPSTPARSIAERPALEDRPARVVIDSLWTVLRERFGLRRRWTFAEVRT